MKSIREWRTEREGVSPQKLLEFNLMTSLRNFAGSSTVKQDSQIRSGLRSKILSLWKDAQASGMTALDFVRQVWAVAGSAVTGKMGGNLNVGATAKGLTAQDSQQTEWARLGDLVLKEMEREMGAQPENGAGGDYEINKTKFAQFANSSTLDVDSKLRSLLRPKIDDIRKMDKYQNMSSAEFFQKVVAAVAAIETDVTSSTASVGSLADKLNKPNEGLVG